MRSRPMAALVMCVLYLRLLMDVFWPPPKGQGVPVFGRCPLYIYLNLLPVLFVPIHLVSQMPSSRNPGPSLGPNFHTFAIRLPRDVVTQEIQEPRRAIVPNWGLATVYCRVSYC